MEPPDTLFCNVNVWPLATLIVAGTLSVMLRASAKLPLASSVPPPKVTAPAPMLPAAATDSTPPLILVAP